MGQPIIFHLIETKNTSQLPDVILCRNDSERFHDVSETGHAPRVNYIKLDLMKKFMRNVYAKKKKSESFLSTNLVV